MPPLIELKDITYRYTAKDAHILHHLNLTVGSEKIGLIGPNGCGKTTLFHIMVGLLTPNEGCVLFDGKEVRDKKDIQKLRKEVGFLFQSSDDQLFSPTVLEDVAFGPLNLGATPDEAIKIAEETLASLGLDGFEERITHRLSGGEKKLVALATILSMKPSILLLDEPTNNLDPATRRRLIDILQELPLAQVIISHDLEFLDATTQALYTIERGQVNPCPTGHIHQHRHIHTGGEQPHHHH